MDDRYKLDDEGNPIAEKDERAAEDAPAAPSEDAPEDGPVDVAALGAVDPPAAGTDAPAEAPAADDPEAQAALRRQVEQTLKFMRLQTAVCFVVLLILIGVLSSLRGIMIIVTFVFLITSAVAYTFLARTLNRRVLGYQSPPKS
jgi:hypothetical protein